MSIKPKAFPKMRIIAIPLTRPRFPPKPPSLKGRDIRLTYYQFQITSPPKPSKPADASDNGSWLSRWTPEGGVGKWVSTKAADTWAGFGKADGGWKVRFSFSCTFSSLAERPCSSQLKTYQAGERLVDRMDFEELALKGIDPSLGPQISQPDSPVKEAENHPVTDTTVT
jgi:hypothetical protein